MIATQRPQEADADLLRRALRVRYAQAACLSLAFKAMNVILLGPLAALILRLCLARWGRASVGNFEIAAFLLSPEGVVALLAVGAILLGSFHLEMAGLLRLLADDRHWWQAFRSSTRLVPRLLEVALRQLAIALVLAIPFAAAIGVVYWLLWSDKDINGLIVLKPPVFWWGVSWSAGLVLLYVGVLLGLLLRWLHVVPILLFEPGTSVRAAFEISATRSKGQTRKVLARLGAWAGLQLLLSVVAFALLGWIASLILAARYESLATAALVTGVLLVANALLATQLGILANVTLAVAVLKLYRSGGGHITTEPDSTMPAKNAQGWGLGTVLIVLLAAVLAASYFAVRQLRLPQPLEITAHRAGATHAPENTIAALKRAIADGAPWAEIDVQLTADQAIVVMHDTDLARVGGGDRQVKEATLAEIQALDVGKLFGSEFAGERIPTLAEVLEASRDKILLNVELKPHGKEDAEALTQAVVAELRRAGLTDRCRICSQSYEGLQVVRKLEPKIPVGFIVATAVGDPTKLDVDFLMVKSSLATRDLVDRARLRGLSVHAWTVNDPADVVPLETAGVNNLITDDPALIRAKLEEFQQLDPIERLLLQVQTTVGR